MNKKLLIGFVFGILLIPIATAQLSAYYDDDIFWDNIDDFWYWLDILLKNGNWTMQNLDVSGNLSVGDTLIIANLTGLGEINVSGVSGSGKVVCVKADGNFGTCDNQPGAEGTCTCV